MTMRTLALFVAFIVLAPAAFMVATPPARAITVQETGPVAGFISSILKSDAITAVKSTLSAALDVTETAATVAMKIKAYVLDPLAFVMSGNLLKSITSSILGFVGGKNGTGKPLYVQNLGGYLQNVGDVQAFNFLSQFSRNSNSPFAGAISSSLRNNYLQETSLAGFFAANRNTLGQASSNPNGFLAGNWSLGGVAAWFSLTTQCQNNPYCFYYTAQNQMARSVQGQTSNKLAQLNWGQGFLSWCGSSPTNGSGNNGVDGTGTPLPECFDANDPTCATGGGGTGGGGTGGGSDFGGGGVDCPIGTVRAGTGGCANEDTHQFELPTGYSCPTGTDPNGGSATFDGNSGGCLYGDGTITVPNDENGDPATAAAGPGVLNDGSPTGTTNSGGTIGHLNYGATGALGDPRSPGWVAANLMTVTSPSGATFRVHRAAAADFSGFLQDLEGAGYSIDRTTSGGYNYRNIANSTNLSEHAYGAAIDINWTRNPVTRNGRNVTDLPTNIGEIAARRNLEWGGNWNSLKDPMHFQWHGPARTSAAPRSTLVASAHTALGGGTSAGAGRVLPASIETGGTVDYSGGGDITTRLPGNTVASSGSSSVRPGDPCTKADGTEGRIQTPGSIIKDQLSGALKALGIDQFIPEIGLISTQISGIMSNIGTVMRTVNMATSLFGGSGNGLEGFSGTSSYTSPFADYLNSSAYLGITAQDVGTSNGDGSTDELRSRASQYEAAWIIKKNTAQAAKDALIALKNACTTQAGAADTALSLAQKVLDDAVIAAQTVTDARAFATQVEDEGAAADPAYPTNLARLSTTAPSLADAIDAEQDARAPGGATADPVGSLTVGGGTTADRMNFIKANADAIRSNTLLCPAGTSAPVTIAPVSTSRVSIPIRSIMVGELAPAYYIQVTIGNTTIKAGLDTGSAGIRVFKDALATSDYTPTGLTSNAETINGTSYAGIVATAHVGIGGLTSNQDIPIEIIQSTNNSSAGFFTTAGINPEIKALIGIGMAESADIRNPLPLMTGHQWFINLPVPGQSTTGALVINPTATDLLGYSLVQLSSASTGEFSGGWRDDKLRGCVAITGETGGPTCLDTLLDTGGLQTTLVVNGDATGNLVSGTPVNFSITGTPMNFSFVTGTTPGDLVKIQPPSASESGELINTGPIPFFRYSVFYDFDNGTIGFKPRT